MKNEVIKQLFDDRFAMCMNHGESIAVLKAGQDEIMKGIGNITVRQGALIDKIDQTEKDVLVLQTQKKGVIALVGAIASAISLGIGIYIESLFRR
jgi:hypothetical protein